MSYGAWHVELGIELNASLPSLGHPDTPGLWEALLASRPIRPGVLECLQPHECPRWMLPVDDRARGLRYFRHYSVGELRELAAKSDEHKAQQEYIATRAERHGLSVAVEHRTQSGGRIQDVHVFGPVPLACEVQNSYIHPSTIARRVGFDQASGDTPLWIANDPNSPVINRAPWSRVAKATPQRIIAGAADLLYGGVMDAVWEDCGYREPLCPDTKRRPCGRKHVFLEPARGVHLDKLVIGAATGIYKPTRRRDGRSVRHVWLPAADHERYHDDRQQADEPPSEPAQQEPTELDRQCRYGQEAPEFTPATPRDTGLGMFVPAPRDASTATHCVGCGTPVRLLDASDQPRCWRCEGPPTYVIKPHQCAAGRTPCGAPAVLYPAGWRCDNHRPSTPKWEHH